MATRTGGSARQTAPRRPPILEALLEGLPDAVVVCDLDGRIEFVNRQTEQLTGYKQHELRGKRVETLIPNDLRARHVGEREDYIAHATGRAIGSLLGLTLRRKDGDDAPVDIALSPVDTGGGLRVVAVVRDLTEGIRLQDEAKREADDAVARAKSELVSLVSQEMRSPLATIIGFTDLLATRDYSKANRRHYLDIVLREARRLAEVVDDFLELEAGRTDGLIPAAAARRTPADVMLIEDDHGFARLMQAEFAASGLSTVWAPEPEMADRLLDQGAARAVVVDLHQPGVQAEQFLVGLLASCGPAVPVVVVTMKPLGQDGQEALRQMGAMAVLGKHRTGVRAAATILAGALKHSETAAHDLDRAHDP